MSEYIIPFFMVTGIPIAITIAIVFIPPILGYLVEKIIDGFCS